MKFLFTLPIIILLLVGCSGNSTIPNENQSNNQVNRSDSSSKDKKLKISSKIVLTKHAKCRMDCRKIDMEEIKEIISKGQINSKKSELKKKPCPILATEGITSKDKQRVRVVFAACKEETKIITVIDLNQKVDDPSCKNCK